MEKEFIILKQKNRQNIGNNDGKLILHCYYKDGKKDGEFKKYNLNEKLILHYYCKNDKLDGEYKEWNNNGKLILHCYYKNGIFCGRINDEIF